ncbi:MAG: NUDIX domain-containing protein [Chloroflexota bacterium]
MVPPRGGCEPGESVETTAHRELLEETGLGPDDVTLSAVFGKRRHVVPWDEVIYDVRETWLLAWVAECEIDTSGFSDLERASISQHRWWTVNDLATSPDRLVPVNLADVVQRLLREGPPEHPIELPI